MKLLLDTHIWLWSLLEPQRLSEKAHDALQDSRNTLFLSPITLWETLILAEKKKLTLKKAPAEWIADALQKGPFQEAQLTHTIAIKSRTIRLPHEDPADRFIAATAWEYGLILITEDKHLKKASQITIFK